MFTGPPGVHEGRARLEIARLVPETSAFVVDVGCSDGQLGRLLKLRKSPPEVRGVEPVPSSAERARAHLDAVRCGHAEDPLPEGWPRPDCVVLADVLEHTVSPWSVLRAWHDVLTPGGVVVVSLPNVQHWSVAWGLAKGKFEYTDEGLLDRTHLRFFTRETAVRLVEQAGLKVERVLRVLDDLPPGASALARTPLLTQLGAERLGEGRFVVEGPAPWAESAALDPLTFQILIVGRKAGGVERGRRRSAPPTGLTRARLAFTELRDRARALSYAGDRLELTLRGRLDALEGAVKRRLTRPGPPRAVDAPRASVIVTLTPTTARTPLVDSLLRSSVRAPFEVLVVTLDAHEDVLARFRAIPGATVVSPPETRAPGWQRAARHEAAQRARGEVLVFVEPEVEGLGDWLDELVSTLEREPTAGLVGGLLLEDAGNAVWGAELSRDDRLVEAVTPPGRAGFLRPVDALTPGCFAARRALFLELDASSEHPSARGVDAPPAHELAELGVQARARGALVLVQPFCRLRRVARPTPPEGTVPPGLAARLREGAPRALSMLVIDSEFPRPDRDSGSLRMFNLLIAARRVGFAPTLVARHQHVPDSAGWIDELRRRGIDVHMVPFTVSPEHELRERGESYDVIVVSRIDNFDHYRAVLERRAPRARVVLDTVDLHFLREQREAELRGSAALEARAEARREQELRAIREVDATLVVSDAEAQILAELCPTARVLVVSNIHAEQVSPAALSRRAPGDARDVVFLGGYRHPPNVDAAVWLATEIFPLVRARRPDLRLVLAGSHPPAEVLSLAGPDVRVTGYVPDLDPLFASARLSIAPLRYGAGVKGKINTSMTYGVPVVATSLAAEGMHLTSEQDVLVADEPARLADAVVRLAGDDELWARLSESGRRSVREHFSFEAAERQLLALRRELFGEPASARGERQA
jgi:glycosyltransferase involved in cell wall biosynthesis/2-polyprenyl-3-methyl-5-hydroxy-6-metoxy-1,4-benzoquinol methylase